MDRFMKKILLLSAFLLGSWHCSSLAFPSGSITENNFPSLEKPVLHSFSCVLAIPYQLVPFNQGEDYSANNQAPSLFNLSNFLFFQNSSCSFLSQDSEFFTRARYLLFRKLRL
jgi:hypothetical protein